MNITLSIEQLHEIIRLARQCQESEESSLHGSRTMQECMDLAKKKALNPNPHVKALCVYLEALGYDELLEVEALMDYGGEILFYDEEERDSLEACIDYIQAQYGGNKGNSELAIDYIVGKSNLADRLEAAVKSIF